MKIDQFREQYPEYGGMSDFELGSALHKKHYPGVPYAEFARRFGAPVFDPGQYGTAEDDPGMLGAASRVLQKAGPTLKEMGATAGQWLAEGVDALGQGAFLSNTPPDALEGNPVSGEVRGVAGFFADAAQRANAATEEINHWKPSHLQGRVWETPSLMQKPEWWVEGVGDAAVSLIPTIAAHVLSGGSSVAGGTVGGWMEGSSLYNDLKKDGLDEGTAKLAATGYGIVSAGLNALGLEKMLGGKTAVKGVFRRIVTGAVGEGVTEYLEEPAQAVFESLARGETSEQALHRFLDSLKNVESGIFGGILGGGVSGIAGRGREDSGPLIDDTTFDTEHTPSPTPILGVEGVLTGPEWDAPPLTLEESWNREAANRGWGHYRTDIAQQKADPFVEGYDDIRQWVKSQEAGNVSAALESGEPIDLLAWHGTEENPVYAMDALPQGRQQLALPMVGVGSALGLPEGTSALSAGMAPSVQTGMPPFDVFSGQGSSNGPGGPGGPGGGGGGTPIAPGTPSAIPTHGQITNVFPAPRADTTAPTQSLGLPGPAGVSQQAQAPQGPQAPQGMPPVVASQAQLPERAPMPPPSATTPSAPVTQQAQGPVQTDGLELLSRAQLLALLPVALHAQARGKTKPVIQEMIRTTAQAAEQGNHAPEIAPSFQNATLAAEQSVVESEPHTERETQAAAQEEQDGHVRRGTPEGFGGELQQSNAQERRVQEGLDRGVPSELARENKQGHARSRHQGYLGGLRREGDAGGVEGVQERVHEEPRSTVSERRVTIKVPGREDVPAVYALVEADDVQASHISYSGFQKNPNYALQNERRYHDEPGSQAKVLENAARLDPAFLLESVDANHGAPVVDGQGNVLGGNGRAMSIQHAYAANSARAGAYRAALKNAAARLGLRPEDVDGMKRPMLVRRVTETMSPAESQSLVTAMNDSFTDSKARLAAGKSRGDRLSDKSLSMLAELLRGHGTLREAFDDSHSLPLVQQLFDDGVLQKTERNAFVGTDGLLNPDGKLAVEQALAGLYCNDYETAPKLSRDVRGKMDAAVPHMLRAESIDPAWAILKYVREANELLAAYRASGAREPGIFLGQVNMFGGKAPRETASPHVLRIFEAALADKKGDFVKRFQQFAGRAELSKHNNALPGISETPAAAFEEAFGSTTSVEQKKETPHHKPTKPRVKPKEGPPASEQVRDSKIGLKIGETIGGSRADTAVSQGKKRTSAKKAVPAWRKRFLIAQPALSDGSWRILHATTGRPAVSQVFSTAEEAEALLPVIAVGLKHRVRSEDGGTFRIVRMVTDRKRATIKGGFQTEADAMRYMAQHALEILETRTGYGEEVLPAPENVYRKGPPRRKGDVKPDDFLSDFGFRGAEFGKWNNQQERQEVLNHAYDALMDLAEILNIPPRALSLNGELGIAFGARGQGLAGAKAHYESGYAVINLTKMSGAGSLAHEWLHALDNYLARQDGKTSSEKKANKRGDMVYPDDAPRQTMASHGFLRRGSGVRESVRNAYEALVKGLYAKAEKYVEDTQRAEKFLGAARDLLRQELNSLRTFLAKERSYGKRFTRPATAEELAKFDALADALVSGEALELEWRLNKTGGQTGRYSNDILDGMSAILKAVRGQSGFMAERRGYLDTVAAALRSLKARAAILESAKNRDEKIKSVPTSYRMDARRMDEGRASDYWGTEHEMLARAFAAYVEDMAAEKGITTDFLVYGANNDLPLFRLMGIRPYPAGQERTDINRAFRKFFETIEAIETDKGVALASLAPGQHLPPRQVGQGMRAQDVQLTVAGLNSQAPASAPVRVVQSFKELPTYLREHFADQEKSLEGVFDPQDGTVYLVADNISDASRAADVWVHEQVVHHGLRSLFSPAELKRVLSRLWLSAGGMGNPAIAEIARRYGLRPTLRAEDRITVMEEYLASLAEKKGAGLLLSAKEKSLWQRFVDAVRGAWDALVRAVNGDRAGGMGTAEIDALLTSLGRHIVGGELEGQGLGGVQEAFAALGDRPGQTPDAAHAAWEQVQADMKEWGRQLGLHKANKLHSRALLTVGATPDVLKKCGAPALGMTMTQEVLGKVGKDKHSLPDDLILRLPELLASPVMVFSSSQQVDSLVAVLETTHAGMPIVAAVHLDVVQGKANINKIASVHGRSGGIGWIDAEIRGGRRLYADKTKIPAWLRGFSKDQGSRRMSGLQLPRAFVLSPDPRGIKILTEKDVVKPMPRDGQSLASLKPTNMDKLTGAAKALEMVKNENIGRFFPRKSDLSIVQRVAMLPHWIAKKFPQFGIIYERQLKRMDECNTDKERSLREVPSLFGEREEVLRGADMDDLRALIWDNEGKEIPSLKNIPKFLDAETLANGRALLKANPEWYAAYEKWLDKQPGSDKAKAAMLEVRRSLDNDLMRAHNRMAAMSELSDSDIADHRTTINHQHNYFPHHRYGRYYVQAIVKGEKEPAFRQHFDALNESLAKKKAAEIMHAQKGNYPGAVWSADENKKMPDEIYGAPLDMEAMEQVIKAAAHRIGDKEQAEQVKAALSEAISDTLKARGWGSHAIGRKGTPGHEQQDILRVLRDYKVGLSGWLSKLEAAKDFSKALGEIDAREHPNEWNYAAQYVKDMLRNYDKIDRAVGNIKGVAFAWYLGANLKTAALNLTQNIIVGIPRLQMDTVGSAGYFQAAMTAIVDQTTGRKGKGLTPDESKLLRELYDNAIITDGYMEEVRGRVSGIDGAAVWNKLLKGMGWPMAVAERFNRASLALAAYRAARSGNLKKPAQLKYGINGKADYEQAKAYAEIVVRDAHFVYGKANTPEFLRSMAVGRVASPMYTFRTFSHNLLSLWHWALTTQGADGRKLVAKSMAATLAIGGIASAPFFATAMALFQALTGDDDDWLESIRAAATKYLGAGDMTRDIICYGLPSVAGVSFGGSLKMETPFSQGLARGSTPKEVLVESLGDIIGIPYDLIVERPSKVMDAYRHQNTWRMVEEVLPTFAQNAMRAYRLHTEGQKSMSGRSINDPGEKGARKITEAEAIGKLLGFQPVSATKAYDRYSASKHADEVRSDKASEFAARVLKAREEGKSSADVRADMQAWNDKMRGAGKPWMVITFKDVQRRVVARRAEKKLTPRERARKQGRVGVWE